MIKPKQGGSDCGKGLLRVTVHVAGIVRFLLALGARQQRSYRHDPPITTVSQTYSFATIDNDGGFQWFLNHNFRVASATSQPPSPMVSVHSWVPTNGRGRRPSPLARRRYT
ncbi:hypothetical protein TIFTF001_030134 [Ficus carica]|uniref:Uncharacterized protein n=1 Tax=Ficus carica TaxID=3494 RepID=A0AA88DTL6_FICCA|nr:hypothetical protein TIFTF001_030134 [Ficus carica]